MSNPCPNALDPQAQSIGVLSKDNLRRESPCGTSLSSQSVSEDLQDEHKTSSEWRLEGPIYLEAGSWSAGKTDEDTVRAAVEEQNSSHGIFSTIWQQNPTGTVETAHTICQSLHM